MKNEITGIFIMVAANIASIIMAIAAFILAYHDKSGWGWFLFGAIATSGIPQRIRGSDE